MSEQKWKEVTGANLYIFEEGGDSIEGKYIKTKPNAFGGENFILQSPNGTEFEIKGSAVITSKMSNVALDSKIKITFLGNKKSKKGLEYQDYKIEIAE